MFLIRSITSYFSQENAVIPLDQAVELINHNDTKNEIKNSERPQNDEDVNSGNKCFTRIGKVVYKDTYGVTIEDEKYFETSDIPNIKVGDKVSYLAYSKDGDVKICRIISKVDEWSNQKEEDNFWLQRKLVGKVINRKERQLIIDPGNYVCDLNKVQTEFVPIVGDWLDIEAITQVDENVVDFCGEVLEITKISPLRVNMITGCVKMWSNDLQTGIINANIFFDKSALIPGYQPMVKDFVSVEIIESDQERCTWRALHVYPEPNSNFTHQKYVSDTSTVVLLQNKNGIEVSEPGKITMTKKGETIPFSIKVKNKSSTKKFITSGYLKNLSFENSQIKLLSPEIDEGIEIEPGREIIFNFSCVGKQMGATSELFVFKFSDFEIGRYIIVELIPETNVSISRNGENARNNQEIFENARSSILNENVNKLVGQKPIRAPQFITNKLEMFNVPKKLTENLFREMALHKYIGEIPISNISPVLSKPLNIQTYADRFHNLIYLEELALQINMHKYDIERASFIRNDEFLMLEVPDLSERRPSVIIGDKIIAYNPLDPSVKYEGFVHKTGAKHVYLKFHQSFHDKYNDEDFRIEFKSSRTNFRRYHQAVDLAVRQLGKDFLFPTQIKLKSPQINFIIDDDSQINQAKNYVNSIREHLKKSSPNKPITEKTIKNQEKIILETNCLPPVKLQWYDKSLNMYQRRAVENILKGEARPLPYFIFGPPGTGKTVTIIETILQIRKLMPQSRILVSTPSNSAADLIALRLLDSGVLDPGDLVRMVAFRCIADGMIPERLTPYCVTGDISREGSRESKMAEQMGIRIGMQASVLGRHRITVGTCMTIGNLYTMGFTRGHFTHIIIDEAGQATEPEILIPMCLLDIKTAQTILAGDPLQLGPSIFSRISETYGLSESFLERLIFKFPYVKDIHGFPETNGYDPRLVTRLVFNYRSLPEILALPNKLFYDSELKPTISPTEGMEVDILKKVSTLLPERDGMLPPSVVFHGVRGENFQTPDSPSWFNLAEAAQVFYYVNDLYHAGLGTKDIGVITPYIKQGQQIRALFNDAELDMPKVGSVEEFQGQEFKVIVLSTVRSNEAGANIDSKFGLGFVASPRRLNVAITRAQALLIIVGNPYLLSKDKYWRSVLNYAIEIGGYRGCDLPNSYYDDGLNEICYF